MWRSKQEVFTKLRGWLLKYGLWHTLRMTVEPGLLLTLTRMVSGPSLRSNKMVCGVWCRTRQGPWRKWRGVTHRQRRRRWPKCGPVNALTYRTTPGISNWKQITNSWNVFSGRPQNHQHRSSDGCFVCKIMIIKSYIAPGRPTLLMHKVDWIATCRTLVVTR